MHVAGAAGASGKAEVDTVLTPKDRAAQISGVGNEGRAVEAEGERGGGDVPGHIHRVKLAVLYVLGHIGLARGRRDIGPAHLQAVFHGLHRSADAPVLDGEGHRGGDGHATVLTGIALVPSGIPHRQEPARVALKYENDAVPAAQVVAEVDLKVITEVSHKIRHTRVPGRACLATGVGGERDAIAAVDRASRQGPAAEIGRGAGGDDSRGSGCRRRGVGAAGDVEGLDIAASTGAGGHAEINGLVPVEYGPQDVALEGQHLNRVNF